MQSNAYNVPKVGRRISLHGNRGTIKYVGEVQGAHGTWLGVEWDNPERGKHSGEKDGKQYFTCRVPGSGSFIRPSPAISYGQSFLTALISKYVEDTRSKGSKETVILGSSNGAIEVEAIGLDKVRGKLARLERLREISLDEEDIAYADEPGDIRRTCPNVRSLDLSSNLLGSWDDVARITAGLPVLRELTLNCNRFSAPSNKDTDTLRAALSALEELRLNGTLIIWPEVIHLVTAVPNLRLLELGYNKTEQLGGAVSGDDLSTAKLEALNLDENRLADWNDLVLSIAPLRMLSRLILTANQFQRIPHPTGQNALPNIVHLGIQDNLLSEWQDIDALNTWFPNLKTLNMNGNPLLSRSTYFRQQAIARLANLEVLNATSISIKEREDSEIYCLSQIAQDTRISTEERERHFPRWQELCEKHGTPAEKSPDQARDTLADRLISIHVHWYESAKPALHVDDMATRSARRLMAQLAPPSTLRVLPTMPVRLLQPRLLKSLRLPFDRTRNGTKLDLWLVMNDDGLSKIELEYDNRDIAWCGIEDGSHIIVFASQPDQQ